MLDIVNHQGSVNQTRKRYHLTHVRMTFFFFKTPKCLQGCGEIDTFRVLIHIKCINFINKAMQSGG